MKRLLPVLFGVALAGCGGDEVPYGVSFTADPNPVQVCDGSWHGRTRIAWFREQMRPIEVRVNTPEGPLFAAGFPHGAAWTGDWVTDSTTFVLLDARSREVLATVTMGLDADCGEAVSENR